ncbi:thiaminase II [Oceanibaculum pacificum]|uniref:Aminopyrimidine aminohydrolase n=1 Tax=Oceanibaculum pacificum TaxID=580166 RepID=A0A154VHH4_9PROT|nr:thiaminase II [Oceanibaculum pacificum]KZD00877.1 thiaminase II [Oceanibaculum pacificum]
MLAQEGSLFARLRGQAQPHWSAYVGHEFVRGLGDGSLPLPAFKHYLGQDYLFLIHFARAYALAVYKSETLEDMRAANDAVGHILAETSLHLRYCAEWGMGEADVVALPEDPACMAYTRYVLERGMAGDILDLQVALAPCVVGYAEIGLTLKADARTRLDGNPYRDWIETYGGDDYVAVARKSVSTLDRLFASRGSEARIPSLSKTFTEATRLEVGFWQMGLDVLEHGTE